MATFTKRDSGQWQAKVRKRGHPTQSKVFSTKALARKWATQLEAQMESGLFVSTTSAENTTLELIILRYMDEVTPQKKSQINLDSSCRMFIKHLGAYSAAAITSEILSKFRDMRLKTVSGSTVRKDLMLIKRILNHSQKEWGINLPRGNPADYVSIPSDSKGRDRRFYKGEEKELLKAAKEYSTDMHDVIVFAIETGARRGEISKLLWENINIRNQTATLLDTKNSEDRTIPLSKTIIEMLKSRVRNINGKVFNMRADSITQAFSRIKQSTGIKDLRFHDLRHEATSRFFEKGFNIMEVSAITGHKDLSMLKRYTHLKAEDLAKRLS